MNEETIYKEINLKDGHVLQMFYDRGAESPREWDNLGTMAIFHKRYTFGDDAKKVSFSSEDFEGWKEMEEYITSTLKAVVCLPIYMYDHSGITINTIGFSCPWDSGQVGFIYVTEKQMQDNYGEHYSSEDIERARKVLIGEVEIMDQYIKGEVYGFQIIKKKDDEEIPVGITCGGFYGDDITKNGMMEFIPKKLLTEES
jgi:hypothetical protein